MTALTLGSFRPMRTALSTSLTSFYSQHRRVLWLALAIVAAVCDYTGATAAMFGHTMPTGLGPVLMASVAYADIATTAVTDVQETFKRVYLMAVDAVPDSNVLSAQFARTRKFKAGPDGLYFNVKLETGGAVANVGDGIKLPRATRGKRRTGKASIAHTYTVVAIGGQSIPLTEDNKQAFVQNLEDQLDDAMTRVRNDVERQDNGDGRGILCLVLSAAGAPTYTLEKAYGLTNGGPGAMLLIEDMDVAIINPGTGAERGRSKITAIDFDANSMTLAASVPGTTAGDYVVLCNDNAATGSDAVNNYNAEASGILGAVSDTGTFENISRTSFKRWRSVVMSNGGTGRRITEKLITTLDARVRARSGKKPTLYYTSPGISIDIQDQLSGLRRFEGETTELKGGYEGVKIKNRTVAEGDWCPKGQWFALNTGKDVVGTLDLVPMGFVDLDGAKLHRVEGRHAYRADLWCPHNIIYFLASANGRLSDLIDDSTITR
jgi:hypothetical protein